MNTNQVSAYTGIPVGTLRYWRHIGEGPPSFHIGRRVVYRRTEIEHWLSKQEARG
ncbi:helix-turn-helix transcriptional regulator [Gordonia insulae]|uniref:helix-turn-helix transcriptional regulator n=1 Tax=Gordonia insulae TaxID=2420509 RepID=UPI000F5BB625|nr:helix-turn-helix domain-containing protein [Gordonia insulae]